MIQWLRNALSSLSDNQGDPLAVSTLRGEREDNREWSRYPSRPAIIIGTVDMIGSRLLFSSYGDGPYACAQHAGLLGRDTLVVNDEAHLTPAFAGLLSKVEAAQRRPSKPLWKSFHTIRLSATHSSKKCWPSSLEEDRREPRFRKIFESSKSLKIHVHPAANLEAKLLELASQPEPARVLIFVGKPENAKEIANALAKKIGAEDHILTLTGTMRGLERDLMVRSPVFKVFAEPETPSESWWLVATSAGEVGVNISADRLITDLDTLDHLLQRFGRLNRFGETTGRAHLLASEAEEKSGEKDPRKKDSRPVLEFLRGLPTRSDGLYDISPSTLFGLDLPAGAVTERPLEAPLREWHIDAWSQTSLGAHPARPAVASWLHGKVEEPPQTYIAWRGDVRDLVKADDKRDLREVLRKYRVLAHEKLREPTGPLVKKLKALLTVENKEFTALRQGRDGSVDVLDQKWLLKRVEPSARSDDLIGELAGRQLILPSGCGRPENGMFSPVWESNEPAPALEEMDGNEAQYDVSAFQVSHKDGKVEPIERRASFRATQLEDESWSLERISGMPGRQYAPERLPDLKLKGLLKFADADGWRFLLKVPLADSEDDSEAPLVALLYFAKARDKKSPSEVYPLDEHLSDVARIATALAAQLGLPEDLAVALELAGEFHDLGKREPIWQKAAGNLKPNGEYCEGAPVAKSIETMRGRDLNGFRHELASLRHAECRLEKRNAAPEVCELVLHLIAAHHGHARPCFEAKAYDRKNLVKSAELALQSAQRLGRLQERYGAWGLAYLESILRAADGIASADWEDPI